MTVTTSTTSRRKSANLGEDTPKRNSRQKSVATITEPTVSDIPAVPTVTEKDIVTVTSQLECLLAARTAAIATSPTVRAKKDMMRKGDILFIVDEKGDYLDSGVVTHKPSASYVTIKLDSNGRIRMFDVNRPKKVEKGMFTVTA